MKLTTEKFNPLKSLAAGTPPPEPLPITEWAAKSVLGWSFLPQRAARNGTDVYVGGWLLERGVARCWGIGTAPDVTLKDVNLGAWFSWISSRSETWPRLCDAAAQWKGAWPQVPEELIPMLARQCAIEDRDGLGICLFLHLVTTTIEEIATEDIRPRADLDDLDPGLALEAENEQA